MKLTVNGDINEYYVQTLCLLFFPASKFSKCDTAPEGSPEAIVDITSDENGVTATVSLSSGGKSITKSYSEPNTGKYTDYTLKRIACGKAFFSAGKALLGVTPQWGILTGVRPAKLALRGLSSGETKTEVKSHMTKEYLVSPKKAALVTDIAATEKKIISKLDPKTCSVYISIPFCPSRCSYCSFVSFTSSKLLSLIDDYIIKLCNDIKDIFEEIKRLGLTVSTVYIGGGTPTTLDEKQLKKLLDVINSCINTHGLEEFTLEAGRPDTITQEKLTVIKNGGVTRVSVNPQTLNPAVLEIIGRHHTVDDFFRAYDLVKNSGIKHVNTDLIAGLPSEGFRSFSETVDKIIELRPDNITVHTLCIKSAADFASHAGDICNTFSETTKCVDYTQLACKNAGYIPYYIYRQKNTVDNLENVGFALPGTEGRYNIYMMEEVHSIFSVGAGAVSKLVSTAGGKIERIFDYKYPYEYLSDKENEKGQNKLRTMEEFYSQNS